MSQSNSTVETSIDFLERNEIWGREKPFLLDYVPEPPAIKSNAVIENRPVSIDDIRGHEKDFSFAKNGFSIFPLKTQLLPEDFDDNTKVEQVHVQEVAEALKVLLEADRVQIYDYTVSLAWHMYSFTDVSRSENAKPAFLTAQVVTMPTNNQHRSLTSVDAA